MGTDLYLNPPPPPPRSVFYAVWEGDFPGKMLVPHTSKKAACEYAEEAQRGMFWIILEREPQGTLRIADRLFVDDI
jgi:hypothetical protein